MGARSKLAAASVAIALAATTLLGVSSSASAQGIAAKPKPQASVTIVAAGDIACAQKPGLPYNPRICQQAATAKLITSLKPKVVVAVGDLAYPTEGIANLNAVYGPTWGQPQIKSITRPVSGNHQSLTGNGYYTYWGAAANNATQPLCKLNCLGYYSFNAGSWHVLVLNSASCRSETTGVCGDFTQQAAWVKADTQLNKNKCTLAFVHNPFWSVGVSATHGVAPLFAALIAAKVDLVVTGHSHNYQRYAPQLLNAQPSSAGITEIVAGTGGASLQPPGTAKIANRVAAQGTAFGVLQLKLAPGKWSSAFVNVNGTTFDPATQKCH